ncbi:hypothetical protein PZA11_004738 [Diplocarpon coronariae]
MKEFTYELSSSGWEIARGKRYPTTGFSGTNESKVEVIDADVLLNMAVKSVQAVRVILDVGAQVMELRNVELARRWLSMVDLSVAEAAIYVDDYNDICVVSRSGLVEPLHVSPYSKLMDRCLVYLDESHTRATDLKMPSDYRAVFTLGPDLTKDRLAQGMSVICMETCANHGSFHFEIQLKVLHYNGKRVGDVSEVADILVWESDTTVDEKLVLLKPVSLLILDQSLNQKLRALSSGPQDLLFTTDFAQTIVQKEKALMDQGIRPVHWVLSLRRTNNSVTTVIISPYEANELLPAIRAKENVTLHVYTPRLSLANDTLENLASCAIPPLPLGWVAPHICIQIGLFAGQLYLRNTAEYLNLCRFLGLCYKSPDDRVRVAIDGFVDAADRANLEPMMARVCNFKISPIPLLRLLFAMRRKGQGSASSHLGRMLNGELLREEHFLDSKGAEPGGLIENEDAISGADGVGERSDSKMAGSHGLESEDMRIEDVDMDREDEDEDAGGGVCLFQAGGVWSERRLELGARGRGAVGSYGQGG